MSAPLQFRGAVDAEGVCHVPTYASGRLFSDIGTAIAGTRADPSAGRGHAVRAVAAPLRKAWLPVLHTARDDRHFTALFSNTANAHELGRTHDWVVMTMTTRNGNGQW